MDTGVIKIKFCGIMNLSDALYASSLGVDALGFIFTSSKRMITPEKGRNIIEKLPPFISKVGVFMNDSFNKIIDTTKLTGIDVIQLHGDETTEFCNKVKKATGRKIIKRIKVSEETTTDKLLNTIQKYKGFHLLFDPGAGDGKIFDWSILKDIDIPFTIAGGLSPLNIKTLLKILQPYAVDVSSGIEQKIGKKDFNKMRKFIEEVKG